MAEDRFANFASVKVTESAAGVLTFAEKLTGVGFGTGKGMLIDQIDYFLPIGTTQLMTAGGDFIQFGFTMSSGVSDLEDVGDNRLLHSGQISINALSAIGYNFIMQPFVYQFFPSLIVGTQRIFLAAKASGLAGPATVRARIYWRMVDLTDRVIAELVQVQILSS